MIIIAVGFLLIATCLSFLRPSRKVAPSRLKGYCPLCSSRLQEEERVHSAQIEIGEHWVHTHIKGCTHCLDPSLNKKRRCPICDRLVPSGNTILALSDPKRMSHRLTIKGCHKCFPQGFQSR